MTSTNKRTSDKLERALLRHNLDALPVDLKTELDAAMKHPDFDPDKLAEALERAEAEKNTTSKTPPSHSKKEKLTFLETVQAIFRCIFYLLMCFAGYNFALCVGFLFGYAMVTLFDRVFVSTAGRTPFSDFFVFSLEWMCTHPTISLTVAIILYVAGFLYFIYKFVMNIADSLIQTIKE